MKLDEIGDRLEIQKNVWDYANAIDFRRYDDLDRLFVPKGSITYGKRAMPLAEAKVWLKQQFDRPVIRSYYHLMGSMWIEVRGKEADSMTRCLNPMEFVQPDTQLRLWFNGMWYHWRHALTRAGWRLVAGGPHAEGFAPKGGRAPESFGWSTAPYSASAPSPALLRGPRR